MIDVQTEVTDLLKREVVLMREILASMYEEEKALVERDSKALQYLMMQRDAPLQDLMQVREERGQKIHELVSLLNENGHKKKMSAYDLTALLESRGLESCEVMVLRDQIIALIEKMNEQNTTNDHIMQQSVNFWKNLMLGSHPPEYYPVNPLLEKRKALMLTVINPEDNEF